MRKTGNNYHVISCFYDFVVFHCGKKPPPCSPSKKKNKVQNQSKLRQKLLGSWLTISVFGHVSQVDISEVEDLEMMKRKKRWRPDPVVRVASGCPPDMLWWVTCFPERWTDWHWRLFFFWRRIWIVQNAWIDWWFWGNVSTFEKHVYEKSPNHDETWWWNIVMDHDLKITLLMAMFCDFQSGLLGRHSETQ